MVRLILFLTFLVFKMVSGQPPPEVITSNGRIRGIVKETIHGREFNAFYRIPYAKPPIGPLRFKEPIPADPWLGIWDATHKPEVCTQKVWEDQNPPYDIVGSEDCLYVNVFTPKLPEGKNDQLLDVLVFIHGGGFQYLAGAAYGPDFILDRDLVYVNFNYRLNVLGFLSFGNDLVSGNNGLKDQFLALQWIKHNIAAFGGDPNKITVAGMSAGGASIHYHILSKKAKGLFQKAIITSGSALNPWANTRNVTQKSLALVAKLGCPTEPSETALECLQQRPAAEILRGQSMFQHFFGFPLSPIAPCIEKPGPHAYIDKAPYDIYEENGFDDIPILWSVNSEEGLFPGLALVNFLADVVDENWDFAMSHVLELTSVEPGRQLEISQKLRKSYMDGKAISENPKPFLALIGDRYFYNGVFEMVELHAQHAKSPQWMYMFSHVGPAHGSDPFGPYGDYEGGACHGDDVGYVLRADYAPIDETQRDIDVINTTTQVWMDFIQNKPSWAPVKDGLPNFHMLDIVGPDPAENVVKTFKRTPAQELWLSLKLPENGHH